MCANHHIVIDENPEYYTVSKLKEIKSNHEQKSANYEEPPDFIVDKLLRTINVTGPVVFSQGQMGGQTAFHIDNYGLRPRKITHAAGEALITRLQNYPGEKFLIDYVGGDYEVLDLTESLNQVLINAKWESMGMAEVNRRPPLVRWGIRLLFPEVRPSFQCFLEWLDGNGFEIDPYVTNSKFDHVTIQIGKNR